MLSQIRRNQRPMRSMFTNAKGMSRRKRNCILLRKSENFILATMTKIIIAFYKQNRPLNPNIIFTEERLGGRLYIPNKQINRQTFISYWKLKQEPQAIKGQENIDNNQNNKIQNFVGTLLKGVVFGLNLHQDLDQYSLHGCGLPGVILETYTRPSTTTRLRACPSLNP